MTTIEFEKQLSSLSCADNDPSKGFFGPGSMMWTIFREPVLILGGMRALLLQIAHPAVAEGVSKYSEFESDYFGRAHRTFSSMVHLWFGDRDAALKVARHLHTMHLKIQSSFSNEHETDRQFSAADPDLLMWVLATLIDTGVSVFEKTVRPLTQIEKINFYEENKKVALLMGIPNEEIPSDYEDFKSYFENTINDGHLAVNTETKAIKDGLFKFPFIPKIFSKSFAAGFLNKAMRTKYNLEFGLIQRSLFNSIVGIISFIYPKLPGFIRFAPPLFRARYRIGKANNQKTSFLEKLHYCMGEHMNFYFISANIDLKGSRKSKGCIF